MTALFLLWWAFGTIGMMYVISRHEDVTLGESILCVLYGCLGPFAVLITYAVWNMSAPNKITIWRKKR